MLQVSAYRFHSRYDSNGLISDVDHACPLSITYFVGVEMTFGQFSSSSSTDPATQSGSPVVKARGLLVCDEYPIGIKGERFVLP